MLSLDVIEMGISNPPPHPQSCNCATSCSYKNEPVKRMDAVTHQSRKRAEQDLRSRVLGGLKMAGGGGGSQKVHNAKIGRLIESAKLPVRKYVTAYVTQRHQRRWLSSEVCIPEELCSNLSRDIGPFRKIPGR
jgi:hypothetical protein